VRLDELAKSLGDKAKFFGVYIREAHAEGEDQVPRNLDEGIVFEQPETEDERAEVAATCMLRYNFSFPMLLDGMDNDAEDKYQSWPDRLYVISADGKVTYQGGMGPLYFDVDEFEQELNKLVDA
jgi:hypothetical protein